MRAEIGVGVVLRVLFCAVWLILAQGSFAYESIRVERGATITGVAAWKGPIPRTPPLRVSKQREFCGEAAPSPVLQVDPASKGVRFALVYLEQVERGKTPREVEMLHVGKTPLRPHSRLCDFEEHVFAFAQTSSLGFQNFEKILHTAHAFDQQGGTFFNVLMPNPLQLVIRKDHGARGIGLHYQCDAHPHMNGWMASFSHPYFAVTDARGRFEMQDVPPGRYTLVAWHESYTMIDIDPFQRPIYDAPHVIRRDIEVKEGETLHVRFTLPDRIIIVDSMIGTSP